MKNTGRPMWESRWVGVVGLLVGVVGVILAVVFYLGSQKERELVYTVSPIRTTVVAAGQASELEILHKGKQVNNGDITAAQVAIWNAGKQSIQQEDVLEDVVIFTEPPVLILEASVRVQSRDVTGFTLLDTPESRVAGKVPVSWQILEENDGASVQLIYVGSEAVNLGVEGTIEGLRSVKHAELGVKIKTPVEQVRERQQVRWVWFAFMLTFGILLILFTAAVLMRRRPRFYLGFFAFAIPYFGISLWQWLSIARAPWPPFGF